MVRRLNLKANSPGSSNRGKGCRTLRGFKGAMLESKKEKQTLFFYYIENVLYCIVENVENNLYCRNMYKNCILLVSAPGFLFCIHWYFVLLVSFSFSINILKAEIFFIRFLAQCGLGLENYLFLPCLFILKSYLIFSYQLFTYIITELQNALGWKGFSRSFSAMGRDTIC